MKLKKEDGRIFGRISNLYDKARVGYPKQLIDDVLGFSRIKEAGKVLDIGCGTGQATALFAERGFQAIGLDISPEMVKVGKKKYASFPQITFEVGAFENIDFPAESFDIITCGMAWHWIAKEGRYEKVYEMLRKQGTLALFWSFQIKEESNFLREVSKILDKYGGLNSGPAGSRVKEIAESTIGELRKSKLFNSVQSKEYDENIEFTKEKYSNLVLSYGWVQTLTEKERKRLAEDLQKLYEKYEEPLMVPYRYLLVLTKKGPKLI